MVFHTALINHCSSDVASLPTLKPTPSAVMHPTLSAPIPILFAVPFPEFLSFSSPEASVSCQELSSYFLYLSPALGRFWVPLDVVLDTPVVPGNSSTLSGLSGPRVLLTDY